MPMERGLGGEVIHPAQQVGLDGLRGTHGDPLRKDDSFYFED